MNLHDLNSLTPDEASAFLRPCVDIPRWIEDVVGARPFTDVQQLLDHADRAAPDWTGAEIDHALSHHPRIGERPAGASAEAALSRREQAGLSASTDTAELIRAGNVAYERTFGRVFLIRAAGRSAEDVLTALTQRLGNPPDAELRVVARELREIALVRLEGMVDP
jgi:2-oxo-4-hydroxy-4-carboxy-5-ureidoimidazoline decarboxylase